MEEKPNNLSRKRAKNLKRFLGPLKDDDKIQAKEWSGRSSAEHGLAMINLSKGIEAITQHTGLSKPDEPLPKFPDPIKKIKDVLER